jgi:hypothetical protein
MEAAMRNLFTNRFVDAAAKTLLCFGFIHLIILVFIAGRQSVYVLNAFAILNLDLFIPALGNGAASFALSYGVVLVVYGLVFARFTAPRR